MVLNTTMVMQHMQSGESVGEIKYKISYSVTAHHMHFGVPLGVLNLALPT